MTWLDASFEMQSWTIDGLTVRFAGSKDHGDHDALLLNPWPQSLLAFEPTWWQTAIDTGQFTWEDAAAEYAALVSGWWCGDYRPADRRSEHPCTSLTATLT